MKSDTQGRPASAISEIELVRMLAKLSPELSLADLADFPNWGPEDPDDNAQGGGGEQ